MSSKWASRIAVLLFVVVSVALVNAQTSKAAVQGRQWRVQDGKLTISAGQIVYTYEPSKELTIPTVIPVENITELQFSSAASRHNLADQKTWPDWGGAITFVGPVVDNVDLSQSKADFVAIQFAENNEIKALVFEVPDAEYAVLTAELRRVAAHQSETLAAHRAK